MHGRRLTEIAYNLSGRYAGSLADGGGEVGCRYEGRTFEMSIELDPHSVCASSECLVGPFSCEVSGIARIDDEPVGQIVGSLHVPRGASAGLYLDLASTPLEEGGLSLDDLIRLEGLDSVRGLGRVPRRAYWGWDQESEMSEDEGVWEACDLTIDTKL